MKKPCLLFLSVLLILGFASSIQAIPNLGVGPTNGGYYRGEYQDWLPAWDVTFIPDTRNSGFYFPSDGEITLWFGANNQNQYGSITPAELYLFSTYNFAGITPDPIFDEGTTIGWVDSIQIDGYKSPDGTFADKYFVWRLPDLAAWQAYGDFIPPGDQGVADSVYGGNKIFKFLSGKFWADLPAEEWLFLVADLEGDFLDAPDGWKGPEGGSGGDTDFLFSPKTTSMVPEPSSMILLGFGLIGLAGFRRKFKKQ